MAFTISESCVRISSPAPSLPLCSMFPTHAHSHSEVKAKHYVDGNPTGRSVELTTLDRMSEKNESSQNCYRAQCQALRPGMASEPRGRRISSLRRPEYEESTKQSNLLCRCRCSGSRRLIDRTYTSCHSQSSSSLRSSS